jgi:2-polyprenyl-3-methyl-5-hydroxy-6-metoxy-1,4-benzoquinol methylase
MQIDGNRFRRKRFGQFLAVADRIGVRDRPVRIIDIGGSVSYWQALAPLWQDRAFDITVVNLDVAPQESGNIRLLPGDACALDYADNSFDIVHSNSVLEHVGHWPRMRDMAAEVRRLAPHYYVQTPNYWFPIEPHYRSAFMHWMPESVRAAMLVRARRGFRSASNYDDAMESVQSINLVSGRQMSALFPDGAILKERLGPLTKSLIAVR